jgi:FMN phosphatase YigB (HAD superfamily)
MREVARSIDFGPFFELLCPPFELRPFLLELKRRYRVALVTNRSAAHGLIGHLGLEGVFDAVASARDKVRPKPAPDIVRLCLERAGVAPEHAIYVGDSQINAEAAGGAGAHFLGVGSARPASASRGRWARCRPRWSGCSDGRNVRSVRLRPSSVFVLCGR